MEVNILNIKNQIKAQILLAGFTMAEAVDALSAPSALPPDIPGTPGRQGGCFGTSASQITNTNPNDLI